MNATEILKENGIDMIKIGKVWHLQKDGKTIIRPDHPRHCYKLLIDEFGIIEPRLKDFK